MSEINTVEISIITTCTNVKQTEEEIDIFVRDVIVFAQQRMSYSSVEINISRHRIIQKKRSTPQMGKE